MLKTVTNALLLALILATTIACGSRSVPTPVPAVPTAAPTATVVPTTVPTVTEEPAPTETASATAPAEATPDPAQPREEESPRLTFAEIGSRVALSGEHGIKGNIIVAGSQTLIIQAFTYDGNCPKAEVRLIRGTEIDAPVATLLQIEARAFEREMLRAKIPDDIGAGDADSVIIYCADTQEALAIARFR